MDCEAEAIITRVYYEFQNGLEPSIDVSDLVDEKEPSKEEKINNVSVKSSVRINHKITAYA